MIHRLKIWPEFFEAVVEGRKRFEIRKADRPFKEGDVVVLQEFDPKTGAYTGRSVDGRIVYLTRLGRLDPAFENYCAFSFSLASGVSP